MEENNYQNKKPPRRLGPILWPLILIGLGVLLLLETLGLLGQSAWTVMWNLWPLIFIAIGLDALFRKKEIFGPVFWIGLGGVFLLYNFGLVDWNAWNTLFRLWPFLLVMAGLEILLGRRSIWLSLPITAVMLGVLAVALGLTGFKTPSESITVSKIEEPIRTADNAEISLSMAVGDMAIYSLEDTSTLIYGEVSAAEGVGVRTRSTMRGSTIIYSVEHNNPVVVPFEDSWQWRFGLTPEIPLDLETKLGVGSMGLVLDQIMLDHLNIGQGVGEVEVILPEGDYRAEVSQAVGQLIIEIPKDIPVRLEISRAITGLSLPADFEKQGDYYYSPGARNADELLRVEISQAVGSITVRYK